MCRGGRSHPEQGQHDHDTDIERLMPFATQAGEALVRASDVERLKDSSEQHAVEKEWLFWMINGFADPVVLTDADNENHHRKRTRRVAVQSQSGRQ